MGTEQETISEIEKTEKTIQIAHILEIVDYH